jgi:hypothetical protein
MKHTKEPWEAVKMSNGFFGAKGQNNDWFVFENALEKDAKRIVACVNACAEFDDPEFIIRIMKGIRVAEGGLPDLKDALSMMEKLKAEQAELLDGIQSIYEYWNRDENEKAMRDAIYYIMRECENILRKHK